MTTLDSTTVRYKTTTQLSNNTVYPSPVTIRYSHTPVSHERAHQLLLLARPAHESKMHVSEVTISHYRPFNFHGAREFMTLTVAFFSFQS